MNTYEVVRITGDTHTVLGASYKVYDDGGLRIFNSEGSPIFLVAPGHWACVNVTLENSK